METNFTIEQALVEKSHTKESIRKKSQSGKHPADIPYRDGAKREATQDTLADLENGPMMSTAEILDFASGIDSTEYDVQ